MNKINMEVEVWKGDWGLPSVDLHCLEVLAFAKFAGITFVTHKRNNPFWSPTGAFPVFKHGKQCYTDLNSISEYLRKKNFSPDFGLNSKQTAEVVALESMLKEQLYPALQYIWWVDEKNFVGLTRSWYGNTLPLPWNFYYPSSYRKNAIVYFESLFPTIENNEFIESEVYLAAEKCLNALSVRLGDSEFFFGNHPTSLDAVVYAYLAPLMKAPFPSNILQNHAKACINLLKFVDRISNRYFLQDVQDYEAEKKRLAENKNEDNPFKLRNNIFAGVVVVFLMSYYALAKGFLKVSEEFELEHILGDDEDEFTPSD